MNIFWNHRIFVIMSYQLTTVLFVCFFQLGMRKSVLYVGNGVLLATVFLFCRILIYPYMYWCYSKYASVPFFTTPFKIPIFCNTFCLLLFSVQVYWFAVIMRGVLRFFQPANLSQQTSVTKTCLNGENGFAYNSHSDFQEYNHKDKERQFKVSGCSMNNFL